MSWNESYLDTEARKRLWEANKGILGKYGITSGEKLQKLSSFFPNLEFVIVGEEGKLTIAKKETGGNSPHYEPLHDIIPVDYQRILNKVSDMRKKDGSLTLVDCIKKIQCEVVS